jgi:hypothetical protein
LDATKGIVVTSIWMTLFYFGSTISYWLNSYWDDTIIVRKDWFSGQLLSTFFLILIFLFIPLTHGSLFLATLFLSYSFAKVNCLVSGCCGVKNLGTKLQKFEAIFVLIIALLLSFSRLTPFLSTVFFYFIRVVSALLQEKLGFKSRVLYFKLVSESLFLASMSWINI